MPVAKSISRLPSTSSMIAPDARAVTIGWVLNTPCGTAVARRSNHSRDLGPGISVTTLRSCGMSTVPPRHSLGRCLGRCPPRPPPQVSRTVWHPRPVRVGTDHRSRPGGLRPAGFGILWPGTTLRPPGVPAQEGEVRMGDAKTYKMYIGGEWVDASEGQTRNIVSPANGDLIAEVPEASAADVDRAVGRREEDLRRDLVRRHAGGAEPGPAADGRPGRGARGRARAPRIRERGQGPRAHDVRGDPGHRRSVPVLRRGRPGPRAGSRPAST